MISLRIASEDELGELTSLIHDEHFDLEDVRHDAMERLVEIPYRRIGHDGARRTLRNWFLYRLDEVDVIRAILRIHNVERCEVHDRSRIGTYSFNHARYNAGKSKLLFRCNENLDFEMTVSDLLVESNDLEVRGTARVSLTFGVIGGFSSKIYD